MAETIEVLVPGGQANPGPPLGPELGPTPVDVQAVVQEINDQTEAFDGRRPEFGPQRRPGVRLAPWHEYLDSFSHIR